MPQVAASNTNALLTCVARHLGNHTLLWKYGVSRVLTAGNVRITSDSRFSVLHDKGKYFEIFSICLRKIGSSNDRFLKRDELFKIPIQLPSAPFSILVVFEVFS